MTAIEVLGVGWSSGKDSAALKAAPAEADLAALVAEYSGTLYRVAFSVLRDATEAEDAVQDSFLRLVQHRDELSGVRDTRTWLIRIVWNLALDRKRRVAPQQMDEVVAAGLVAQGLPADEAMAEARRIAEVYVAIDRLPGKEREVLLLSAMQELETAEIAAVLERSESSVRSTLFRARARLKVRLAKMDRQRAKQRTGGWR